MQVPELVHLRIEEQQSGLFIRLHADVLKDARPDLCLEQLLVQLHRRPRAQVCTLAASLIVQMAVSSQFEASQILRTDLLKGTLCSVQCHRITCRERPCASRMQVHLARCTCSQTVERPPGSGRLSQSCCHRLIASMRSGHASLGIASMVAAALSAAHTSSLL